MTASLRVVDGSSDDGHCGAPTRSGRPCRRQVAGGGLCGSHEPEPLGVADAAGVSRRALLTALRNKIASDIDEGVPARDMASLSKRLLDISKELESLEKSEDGDTVTAAADTPDEPWGDEK